MANGIGIINGFDVSNQSPIDKRWGPYSGSTLNDCITAITNSGRATYIPTNYRYEGMTVLFKVGTNPIVEYWFKGGVTDDKLVLKQQDSLSSSGGTVTGDVAITGELSANALTIASNTLVTNLNADMLDGFHASYFVSSARTISAGAGLAGGGDLSTNITISHADTSSVTDITSDNSNGVVIQDISLSFDTFGHITLANVGTYDLDTRYFTQAASDARYVNTSGDTMTGPLTIHGALSIFGDIYQSGSTYTTHTEQVYTEKDYIILRENATAGLSNGQYTGFEAIKYDGVNNGRLVFDKLGVARVGDVGFEQPLATRDESGEMFDLGFVYWDSSEAKLKTTTLTPVNIYDTFFSSSGGTISGNVTIAAGSTISGNGSGLTNIQASSVVGLQLDRIVSGSNSAIVGTSALTVNTAGVFTGALSASNLSGTNTGDERYTNLTPMPTGVGGANAGTTFNNMTIQQVFDYILYPEVNPTLTAPSSTFTVSLSTYYEVGVQISSLTFTSGFSRGAITPDYTTSYPYSNGYRSGLPTQYNLSGAGLSNVASSSLSQSTTINNYIVLAGAQSWAGSVTYAAGSQPYTSKLNPYNTALAAGTTSTVTRTTTGLYPFLYGMTASVLDGNTLYPTLSAIGKLVETQANKTVTLNGSLQYIYFAYPSSYSDLVSIIDQNGFNVTASFTKTTISVTSTGLASNFTTNYKVYRTIDPTSVSSGSYQFKFS